jgi:hypothetical protein
MSESPVQIVHRHVEAMSSRDIAAFTADLADTVRLINRDGAVMLDGSDALYQMYQGVFAGNPELKVELMDRISVGVWVIDEHLTTGFADGSQAHVVRVYRVEDGKIQSIQVFQ